MRVGVIQFNPIVGNFEFNLAQILKYIDEGLSKGIHFFVTPELALVGYPPKDFLSLSAGFEQQLRNLEKICTHSKDKNYSIILGGLEKNPQKGKPFFNTAFVISKGKILGRVHKTRLPSYDIFEDERFFESGVPSPDKVFTIDNFKFKIAICEDLWNSTQAFGLRDVRNYVQETNPLSQMNPETVDLIIHVSASPFWKSKIDARQDLLSASAAKTRTPHLMMNQVGAQDEIIFDGSSFLCQPNGVITEQAPSFKEGLFVFDLDKKNATQTPLEENSFWSNLFSSLVLGLSDYFRKTNFQKCHLGISGGIDSALAALLCQQALGSENVKGLLLPSALTSARSIEDATLLCENLKIGHEKISISEIVSVSQKTVGLESQGLSFENLQSRIRGLVLMAYSNKNQSLLVSTGNKCEYAMGYATLYGDMCGAINPLGDLYKTEVYGLCHFANHKFKDLGLKTAPIPQSILMRAPTAELAANQVDEDSLAPYEILDGILYELIENQGKTLSKLEVWNRILGPKYPVKKILSAIARAEFKRHQSPPILKTHLRSFGKGWHFPVVSGRWPE